MADKKPKREDRIDEHYRQKFDPHNLSEREKEAAKQADNDRKLEEKPYGPPQDGTSTDEARRQEEAALTSGLYTGAGKREQRETVSLKTVLKKKGPLGALIALGLGLPTVLTIMLSPALLLQQLAETMTGEFNDQLAALDVRSTHLLKKKLNSTITKRVCGTKVTIGCKYRSIRENSGLAKRLKKAGIEIDGDKSIIPGRTKPTHFIFEGKPIPAKDLLNEARKNPALRSALRKGYDPLFAAFSDKVASKVRVKLGLRRTSQVDASSDRDKMNKQLQSTAAGELEDPPHGRLKPEHKDGKATGNFVDESGRVFDASQASLVDEALEKAKLAESVKKAAVKAGVKSALTVTALGAGAVDSACTAWIMVRVAAFAAKIYQQRQLIRYSYEFMKVADKQKYESALGNFSPEEMDYYATKLTTINNEGKGAFDSPGYKFAAYGDTFSPGDFNVSAVSDENSPEAEKEAEKVMLQNETSRYVNGQLLNDNLMTKLALLATAGKSSALDKADETCKFVKSWKGQGILIGIALVGAALGIISGGGTIGWGTAANAATSVALSVAFALIQPKLLDMVKGEVIKGDESGHETGNAIASGQGGQNAEASQLRGLGVATQDTYTEYASLNEQVLAKNAEIERSELSPFDPTSKNTFLGSIVSSILPFTSKISSVGTASLAASSFVSSSFASIGTKQAVYAAGEKDKYTKCEDNEYKHLAADPFCNLRYAISPSDLEIDSEEVLDFMLRKDSEGNYLYIKSDTDPTPIRSYAEYQKTCINREVPIGDISDGNDGTECIIGKGGANEYRNRMFRLFTIDQSVSDGMDEDFPEEPSSASNSEEDDNSGTSFSGEIAWPLEKRYWNSNKSDWLDAHSANSGTWTSGVDSLAVDISATPDDPVFAMLGGTVSKADLGGHGLAIKSEVPGGTVEIAYAHGPRADNKTSYQAGDRIMSVGCLGNCGGPHLHIDMAFNGKGVCPQDVFLAMDKGEDIDWAALSEKGVAPCAGRS